MNEKVPATAMERLLSRASVAEIARACGVKENTLHVYLGRMRRNPKRTLPPELIIKLCRTYRVAPYEFNPELWPNPKWRF